MGVPKSAKTSVPWCRWGTGVSRGARKSSEYFAIPATGNGGPARIRASREDIPSPMRGATSATSPAVEAGAVRTKVGTRGEKEPAVVADWIGGGDFDDNRGPAFCVAVFLAGLGGGPGGCGALGGGGGA